MDKLLRETVEEIVKEELAKMMEKSSFGGAVKSIKKGVKSGESASRSLDKAVGEDIGGPRKKVLRKKGGKLQIVKKRKKKLPLHLRPIKPSQAKRIARKSAIKRKGKQARISKKAAKTTKKGRAMGLYKKSGR
jgi:hypothetical protein